MFRKLSTLFAVSILVGCSLVAQDCLFQTSEDDSLRQSLKGFHDVLSSLVHGPAAKGDFGPVKEKAATLSEWREKILASNLTAQLAKRCGEISARASSLSGTVDKLVAEATADSSDEVMKAALDEVHNAYRDLNNSLTTLEDLLEAFHDVMHPLWHEAYPDKDVEAIKAAIPKLSVRAKLIVATAESTEPSKLTDARSLLEKTELLTEAGKADDELAVLEALRITHDAYEKLAEGQ